MRALCLFLFLSFSAHAQVGQIATAVVPTPGGGCSAYSGYGDAVSGAAAFFGLQGYSCLYAQPGNNPAIAIRSGNTGSPGPFTINILSNGKLDIATAITDAGTDATCTGANAASGSVTLSGCSSTPHVGSTITGTVTSGSLGGPIIISSVGTFTGGTGAVDITSSPTFVLTSTTITYGMFITEYFDQTGNGNNCSQGTTTSQAQLLPNVIGSLPAPFFSGGLDAYLCGSQTFTNPISIFSVNSRTLDFTSNSVAFSLTSNGGNGYYLFSSTANTIELLANLSSTSGSFTTTASDSAMHSFAAVANGASPASFIIVDGGSSVTGTSGTGNVTSALIGIGASDGAGGQNFFPGYITISAYWTSALTSTQLNSLCHVAFTAGWTGTSC